MAAELRIDAKELSNFLAAASDRPAHAIGEKFRKIVANDFYYEHAPEHIRAAIRLVYGFGRQSALNCVLERVIDHDPQATRRVSDGYSGLWSVFSFTAHSGRANVRPSTRNESEDAAVVRCSLEVSPPPAGVADFATFRLEKIAPPLRSIGAVVGVEGCLLPLAGGPYMSFLGAELSTLYPFSIRAHRVVLPQASFFGMIVQHTERGDVLTARAAFVRSHTRSLEDLRPTLGIYRESELRNSCEEEIPEIGPILEAVINEVDHDGKSPLWF